jgi:hypothetical protein
LFERLEQRADSALDLNPLGIGDGDRLARLALGEGPLAAVGTVIFDDPHLRVVIADGLAHLVPYLPLGQFP